MLKFLGRYHIVLLSIVIAHIFTYANVETPFTQVVFHSDYVLNFILNGIQIYIILRICHYLSFERNRSIFFCTIAALVLFLLFQLMQYPLIKDDVESITELKSITLPFGALIIIGINISYGYVKKKQQLIGRSHEVQSVNPVESIRNSDFWVETAKGQKKVAHNDFLYAILIDGIVKVHTVNDEFSTHLSLSRIVEHFVANDPLIKFNRQCVGKAIAVQSFEVLSDGRLNLRFKSDYVIVSKNRASKMKALVSSLSA